MTNKTTPKKIDFAQQVHIPPDVMMQELDGEAVILNLKSEMYFGLDDVGTRMWTLLSESPSIQAAFDTLANEYDVEENTLRNDLTQLLHNLSEHGLLVLTDVNAD